jgi:hypothetical protein
LKRNTYIYRYIPCGHCGRGEGREKGSGSQTMNSGTISQQKHSQVNILYHPTNQLRKTKRKVPSCKGVRERERESG